MTFDPRKLGTSIYDSLVNLRGGRDKNDPIVKKQKSQAQELYTYLGLTGLGLAIAQEFSFWTTAIYYNVSGDD